MKIQIRKAIPSYVIRTAGGGLLEAQPKKCLFTTDDPDKAKRYSRGNAIRACTALKKRFKSSGLYVIHVDGIAKYDTDRKRAELDAALRPITAAYGALKRTLDALPASRMRAMAISALEVSFSRAVFAASQITDPILRPGGDS